MQYFNTNSNVNWMPTESEILLKMKEASEQENVKKFVDLVMLLPNGDSIIEKLAVGLACGLPEVIKMSRSFTRADLIRTASEYTKDVLTTVVPSVLPQALVSKGYTLTVTDEQRPSLQVFDEDDNMVSVGKINYGISDQKPVVQRGEDLVADDDGIPEYEDIDLQCLSGSRQVSRCAFIIANTICRSKGQWITYMSNSPVIMDSMMFGKKTQMVMSSLHDVVNKLFPNFSRTTIGGSEFISLITQSAVSYPSVKVEYTYQGKRTVGWLSGLRGFLADMCSIVPGWCFELFDEGSPRVSQRPMAFQFPSSNKKVTEKLNFLGNPSEYMAYYAMEQYRAVRGSDKSDKSVLARSYYAGFLCDKEILDQSYVMESAMRYVIWALDIGFTTLVIYECNQVFLSALIARLLKTESTIKVIVVGKYALLPWQKIYPRITGTENPGVVIDAFIVHCGAGIFPSLDKIKRSISTVSHVTHEAAMESLLFFGPVIYMTGFTKELLTNGQNQVFVGSRVHNLRVTVLKGFEKMYTTTVKGAANLITAENYSSYLSASMIVNLARTTFGFTVIDIYSLKKIAESQGWHAATFINSCKTLNYIHKTRKERITITAFSLDDYDDEDFEENVEGDDDDDDSEDLNAIRADHEDEPPRVAAPRNVAPPRVPAVVNPIDPRVPLEKMTNSVPQSSAVQEVGKPPDTGRVSFAQFNAQVDQQLIAAQQALSSSVQQVMPPKPVAVKRNPGDVITSSAMAKVNSDNF